MADSLPHQHTGPQSQRTAQEILDELQDTWSNLSHEKKARIIRSITDNSDNQHLLPCFRHLLENDWVIETVIIPNLQERKRSKKRAVQSLEPDGEHDSSSEGRPTKKAKGLAPSRAATNAESRPSNNELDMADSLPHQTTESQSQCKAREILNKMSQHRIDPSTIKMTDSKPFAKGGQATIVVGTRILPEEVATWIPEQFLKTFREMKLAIKKFEWNREDAKASAKFFNSFAKELSIMASLCHPNIIKFIGFVEDMEKGDAWIVLPLETNGNVQEFLASGEWDIPERISLLQDVVDGVEYLHTRQPPICHGDLKSLNILVNSSYRAVITDFGSARTIGSVDATAEDRGPEPPRHMNIDDQIRELISPKIKFDQSTLELTLTGPGYSLRWTAPEVLRDGPGAQDSRSDMWALGWICWEIFTGKIPFEELKVDSVVISNVIKGNLPAIRGEAELSLVLQLCSLITDCWMSNPGKRIDASTFQRKARFMPSSTPSGDRSGGATVRSAALLNELGTMYRLQDNAAVAESHYQSAIEVATQTKDDRMKANALDGLGDTYRAQSRYQEAVEALREAHEIYSRIGDDQGAANALLGLGSIYCAQSKDQEAEKAFVEAHEIHCRTGNDAGEAHALNGLGEIYRAQWRHREAEKAFTEAHEIHSRIGDDMGAANALGGLGNTYRAQSRHREAEKAFTEAHEIHSRIGDDMGAANALGGLGNTYRAQSRHREAEKAFTEAHEIHSRIGNDLGAANALLGLGTTFQAQSRKHEAENALNDAHKIYSRIGDSLRTGNALLILAIVHSDQNRYDAAEASYRQAAASYHLADRDDSRARALLHLGKHYHAQGRYSDAEEAVSEALATWISIVDEEGHADASLLLAQIFKSQSRHNEEKEALIQAEAAFAEIGRDEARAETLDRIGDIHLAQSMYDEAEECYRLAQAIFSSLEDVHGEATQFLRLGLLYGLQDRHDEAEECFAEARAGYARAADEKGEANALDGLATAYLLQGKFADARVASMEAREIYTQMGRPMSEACAENWNRLQGLEQPT